MSRPSEAMRCPQRAHALDPSRRFFMRFDLHLGQRGSGFVRSIGKGMVALSISSRSIRQGEIIASYYPMPCRNGVQSPYRGFI